MHGSQLRPGSVRATAALCLFLCFGGISTGCARQRVDAQLGRVAKEWSKTIRASQVIPIYPLSEDLTVGDCFVVQQPAEDEVEIWNADGFLPLTHHVFRLAVGPYNKFYAGDAYGVTDSGAQPAWLWQRPREETPAQATRPDAIVSVALPSAPSSPSTRPANPKHDIQRTHWADAPRASFPSFTITVSTKTDTDLSLPISGIPFGLSALHAEKAVTSVTLSDAYTYGRDAKDVMDKLEAWADSDQGATCLRRYEPVALWDGAAGRYRMHYSYVRVVHRVYLVGAIDVSMQDTSSTDLGMSAIKPDPKKPNAAADWQKHLTAANKAEVDRLNAALIAANSNLPGGALHVTDKTSRSISMRQKFDRPLVVGYISFDVPIGTGGKLGDRVIATQTRLRDNPYDSIAQWAAWNPETPAMLEEWVGTDDNLTWLLTQDVLPAKPNGYNNADAAKELRTYLQQDGLARAQANLIWTVSRVMPNFALKARSKYDRVSSRILEEVIRQPIGLRSSGYSYRHKAPGQQNVTVAPAAPPAGTTAPLAKAAGQ